MGIGGTELGTPKTSDDLADVMFWPGVYTDFPVEAIQRLF